MATKKILLSNGNTKYQETGSITVEDTTGLVTVNSLQATQLTLASLNGILSSSNGTVSSFSTAVTSGSIISSNGTSWTIVPSGTLYGDLSGTLSSPIVKSISNVTTGILGVARGGTGIASPTANTVLFGNGTNAIITSSTPSTNDILKYSVSSSAWVLGTYPPNTASFFYQFHTASGNASIPDWATHARFIIQGAGGGGGGGAGKSATNTGAGGGGGGGAGGLTDLTIKVGQNFKFYDVSVTIGAGGTGALSRTAAANANGLVGTAGGDSYIYLLVDNGASAAYYYRATGGSAGGAAVSTGGVGGTGGAGGKGLTADGAAGGTGSTLGVASSNMSGSSVGYGAGGGGGGGGNTTGAVRSSTGPGGDSGITTGILSTAAGNSAAAASATNGTDSTAQLRTYGLTTGTVTPAGITLALNAAGGAGGTASTTTATAGGRGGNGTRGSGGGGGGPSTGAITGSAPQNGGNGGDGYVLMICW